MIRVTSCVLIDTDTGTELRLIAGGDGCGWTVEELATFIERLIGGSE